MTKHTPAPWHFDGNHAIYQGGQNANPILATLYAHKYQNGDQNYDRETLEANASLIAAAPDLLAALQELTSYATKLALKHPRYDRARAAIAKAKGGA